jgi:hypothetical protein
MIPALSREIFFSKTPASSSAIDVNFKERR